MVDLVQFQYENNLVRVICIDGQIIEGHILSVDDEEESGFNEIGITIVTNYGRYLGIGQSEIKSIERILYSLEN